MMPRLWVAFLMALVLVSGCAGPQTQLRPDPPLIQYALLRHPFHGAVLYRDPVSEAATWQAAHGASWLEPITSTPQARWLNGPRDLDSLASVSAEAARRHQLLVLVTYYIPDRGCTHHRDGAATADAYQRWIDTLIARLGPTKAAIIVEPDAIPADCYDAARAATLTRAVNTLVDAGQYVYLDAGHPAWLTTGEAAERLIASGISRAEGFAVNVANRQTTTDAQRWGRELSDLVGGREFVIDTSRNGIGPPPDDPDRADEWCNPEHQALGQPPPTRPDLPGVAALLWIKRPGESDGLCGGESTYMFAPRQARTLIANSPWVAVTARAAAVAAPAA
jgi:endoglucanase